MATYSENSIAVLPNKCTRNLSSVQILFFTESLSCKGGPAIVKVYCLTDSRMCIASGVEY